MEIISQTNSAANHLWVEKYRPKHLDDIVLESDIKEKFSTYIMNKEIPHLLFYGPPGCGKSTISRILVSYITPGDTDLLILNGSEQRGIDTIRNNVIEFLKYQAINSKHRIVFIDEADALTETAFNALRRVFEEFYENGRFILTCNYIYKIPDPIRSRCTEFKFQELPTDFIKSRCINILKNENINFEESVINNIVSYNYPDFRKIIQNLQKFSTNGELKSISFSELMDTEDIVFIKTKELFLQVLGKNTVSANKYLDEIIDVITQNELDYVNVFKRIFTDSEIIAPVKIISNKYLNELSKAVLPSIHYSAYLFESIEMIKKILV